MADMILFPSDFFDITRVDEDLQREYEAVKAVGLFEIVLFKFYNEMVHKYGEVDFDSAIF